MHYAHLQLGDMGTHFNKIRIWSVYLDYLWNRYKCQLSLKKAWMKSLFAHWHVIENIRMQIHFKFLPVLICPNQLRYVSILAAGVVLKIILCSVDEETQSGEIVVVPPHLVEIVDKFSLQHYIAKVCILLLGWMPFFESWSRSNSYKKFLLVAIFERKFLSWCALRNGSCALISNCSSQLIFSVCYCL